MVIQDVNWRICFQHHVNVTKHVNHQQHNSRWQLNIYQHTDNITFSHIAHVCFSICNTYNQATTASPQLNQGLSMLYGTVSNIQSRGKKFLTKVRITGGADFSQGDNVMWHRPLWSIAAGCCSPAVAVIDFVLHKAPQHWTTLKLPLPEGILTPI